MNRALFVAVVAGAACSASAQVIAWNAAVNGDWNTAANWNPANVPNTTAESALFGHASPYVVTLNTTVGIGGLTLTNPDAALEVPAARTLTLNADCANDGLISLLGSGATSSDATLRFNVNATLSGSGAVRLGEEIDCVLASTAGATVVHAAGHTIAGRGVVSAALDNRGLVDADVAGGTLQLSSADKLNSGVLRASAGTLLLSGVSVSQSDEGVVRADGAPVRFANTCSITGGRLESLAGGWILLSNSGTTLRDVTIDAEVRVEPGGTITAAGAGLTNLGLVRLLADAGSASNSTLSFAASGTLAGAGEVRLEEEADAIVSGVSGAVVTNGIDHRITGIGVVSASLVNEGVVDGNVPGGTLRLSAGSSTNNGLVRASSGAYLEVSSAAITQGAGGILRADGGTLRFFGTGSVSGGAVEGTNAGFVLIENATTTMSGVVTRGDVRIDVNGTVRLAGSGVENQGRIRLLGREGNSGNSQLHFQTSAELSGSGELRLEEETDCIISSSPDTTGFQGAGHRITGVGDITATLVNRGLVSADAPGVLRVAGPVTNEGTMNAAGSGLLRIAGVSIDQSPAGVIRADAAPVELTGACAVSGGIVEGVGGGVVTVTNGTATLNGVELRGDLAAVPGGEFAVAGGVLANNGLIRLRADPVSALNSVLHFVIPGVLGGTGEVSLEEANDARITGAGVTLAAPQRVSGIGTIAAPFANAGTLAPGLPRGRLVMGAGLVQTPAGQLEIEFAGEDAAQRDLLSVTGAVTLDGTLRVEYVNGFKMPDCTEYTILTATAGVTGVFAAEDLPPMPLGRVRVVYQPGAVLVRYFPADVNNDGTVDFFDYLDFVAAFDREDPLADFNNDQTVDFFDYLDFVAMFDVGC